MWEHIVAYAKKIWEHPTLKRDLGVVLLVLIIYRLINAVPVPGVDITGLKETIERNEILGVINMFTGGGLDNFSLVMLGVGPHITSSIVMQLLTLIVPRLEELSQEGESGRHTINQYTRILTVPLAILQSFFFMQFLQDSYNMNLNFSILQWIIAVCSVTAGSMLLVWLGEIISERKVGNGVSIIIFAGIVAGLPRGLSQLFASVDSGDWVMLGAFGVLALATVVLIVFMNDAQRNVPVSYARHGLVSKANHFLPLKVNAAGVIPIIFAISIMLFPNMIAQFMGTSLNETVQAVSTFIQELYGNQVFYAIAYFILVVAFTYFYTTIVFQPKKMAENLQRQNGFIPGVRPGGHTEEYLSTIMTRVTLTGALFLALVAVLPFIAEPLTGISTIALGGTSLLIVVAVVIDTVKKIQGKLVSFDYDRL